MSNNQQQRSTVAINTTEAMRPSSGEASLGDRPPQCALPYDRQPRDRHPMCSPTLRHQPFVVDSDLHSLIRAQHADLGPLFLSAFVVLLHRYDGHSEIRIAVSNGDDLLVSITIGVCFES